MGQHLISQNTLAHLRPTVRMMGVQRLFIRNINGNHSLYQSQSEAFTTLIFMYWQIVTTALLHKRQSLANFFATSPLSSPSPTTSLHPPFKKIVNQAGKEICCVVYFRNGLREQR